MKHIHTVTSFCGDRMARTLWPSLVALAFVVPCLPAVAAAGPGEPPQQRPAAVRVAREPGRVHSFEFTVGASWLGSDSLGTSAATMLLNGGGNYTYFDTSATRGSAPAFHARLGYNLTRLFTVETGLLVSSGNVQASVQNDAEQVPDMTFSAERLRQYMFDAAVQARLRHLAFSHGAGVPYLQAGVGYLRQMHQANLASAGGQFMYVGGGATYMFSKRPGGGITGIGFRADARLYVRHSGYNLNKSTGAFLGIGAGLLVAF